MSMFQYLKKRQFSNFTVFGGHFLGQGTRELNGRALPLNALSEFKEGFDVLITCAGLGLSLMKPSIAAC